MFEVPVASEICNLTNFLVLDVVILSLVMLLSGKLAGHANHAGLAIHNQVQLINFDVPMIGGGLVMGRGWRRNVLIALRVSVVVCVAACNFGLEGRSRVVSEPREMLVRRPGNVNFKNQSASKVLGAVEASMSCGSPEGNSTIVFGAVLDGQCYVRRTDFVYVRRMNLRDLQVRKDNISATNCIANTRCDTNSTVIRCREVHAVCRGVEQDGRCANATGPLTRQWCRATVRDPENGNVHLCTLRHLHYNSANLTAYCRYIQTRWEDVLSWSNYINYVTNETLRAVFVAAYAVETQEYVSMPTGQRTYTVVRLWWILPTSWVICVAVGLALWWVVDMSRGFGVAAHDERGLVGIVGHQLEAKCADSERYG